MSVFFVVAFVDTFFIRAFFSFIFLPFPLTIVFFRCFRFDPWSCRRWALMVNLAQTSSTFAFFGLFSRRFFFFSPPWPPWFSWQAFFLRR